MKTAKRLLALLLVLAMTLSNLPVGVLAAEFQELAESAEAPAETTQATEAPTEAPVTEAPAEVPTEASTEAPTEAAVEAATEEATEEATEAVTEAATGPAEETEAAEVEATAEAANETEAAEEEETHDPYLSFFDLEENEDGELRVGNTEIFGFGMCQPCGAKRNVIFYLNTWNEETGEYDAEPVHVTAESNITVTSITDAEFEDGQPSDYFVTICTTAWDTSAVVSCGDVTLVFGTQRAHIHFFSEAEISNETVMYDLNADEQNVFYIGFTDYDDGNGWSDVHLADFCAEYAELEYVSDVLYKITLKDNARDFVGESGWAGVLVLYTWTAEGETYGQWQPFFMTPNPYLTYGWLEMDWDRENGAYYEGENHGDTGFNVVPEQFHFQIYYLHAWDEEQECMVETPVAVEDLCCDSSAIAINAAKDFADIRDGEENADCFARIGGLEWGAESEIYVNLNGERVQGVYCNTFLPEWACYSSAEISYSTFTSDYCVDPDADENAFYVGLDSDHWSVKGDAYVNEDWEDLLSVQSCDTDNMFKIVLTDYAMEGVLRGDFMWPSILVDVVDGDGNTETWETGLFVYANDEDLLTEPYLSMAWLEYRYDEGQDMEFVYEPENDDAKQGQGFNICLGNKYSMIYYLNVWDADQGRYVAQPVMPKCDGSLIFNPVDNAGEGEENSAYFVQVSTNASEPEDVEVYVDYEGQRYSFVATIALHNFALYESEEMNFDTYLADEETLINVDLYGENYVYAGFQGYEDWELVDIYVHPESEGYVELEAVEGRDDLWKLTVTQEGINRNLYQYLLGIGVCAELQNVNDENWTETRECWFTLSRMELETYGWMHISGGGYTGDFEIIDGGYIYYYETDDEDAGSILMTELPEGLTYDQTTNTLTMDNFDGEWMGFSAEVLPSDSLTIELIGDNSLINSACTAFEACDGLNVTITGDGSLYVKTTNDYFQDDGGNAYVDDTWRMNGGRLTIKGNASVTIEAAGEGNESCWDENGNKLGERTGGVAVLSMGHGQLYIKDNAYLKTVIPEGAQRNGAEDVGEDNAIWDDRFPGGFRGIADASLFVSGGTLVTQSLECQSGYNDDGSIWINNYTQTGGSVTIQATGWNSYTDEGVFHTHYEGLSIRQDCSAQISGGTLTVEVEATPAQLASSTYYEAIMVRGGELTISGDAEVTVSANHENGSLVGVSCEYGEEGVIATGSLTINGGTLNVNGAKGEGNGRSGIYCDFDTVFTMTDGTINSEYADFMNHGPAHISGGTINIGGQYLYDTWFDENGNPVAWITGFHAGGPGFTIDGGEINVTNGHFIAGGMIAVNGGVINIENGKLEVDAGFGFNDGEINITNNVTELTEAGYFWPSLEVNTYFSMGGTEDDENKNPTLTIDHNIDTYAVYVTGTYHQMNGTVDFGTDCEGYCFKVLRTYEDEEVVGHGTLLLNGGTIHAEGPLYDESVSEWDDSNKAHTTFIDLEPECEMQLNGATIDVTRARLNLGGTVIINDGAINGYDTSINLDNEAIINGGTIDLDAWSLLFANGMVAMNGGVIDLSNTIMQVNGGFSLNDGEIIIDNTNEELFLGYNTLCLYVGCYMSIGGSEIENANPTLTVKQSMEAPAVIVEGTMHLMDGTVEVTQPATGAPAVYLSEAVYDDDGNPVKTDDDGNPIGGEFLVNGGQLTINSAEEGNCAGIVTAPTSVYFMNGGIADLNGTNLVVGGQMYLYDKAVLNVNDGIVELCDGSYTELDYGKLNLDANGQIIEGATAAFLTEAGSQVLMKNGQINVDSHVYDCTMEIRGTYTQRNGALNVDSSVVGLFLSGEADISDGIVFVNGGYVVVNSGDTADALNLNDMVAYSLDSGKHLLPVNYTIMFDESGNATEDPAQASTIRYIVNFEEDNTPGNLDTEEGVDRVSNMVIVTGKSGNHTTWDLTDGLLTFGGDGGMYDYITETAPWYWLRNFITGVEVDSNMGYLGAYAFDGLSNDVIIRFLSYAPSFSPNAFNGFSGDARYPLGRDWTTDMLKDYGGDVTWILDQNTLEVIDILTDKDVLLSGQKTTLTARLYPEVDAKATVVWSLAEGDENYASLTVKKNIATVTAKTVTEKNVVTVYAVVKDGLAEPIAQEVTIYPMAQSVAIYSGETNVTGTTRKVDIDVSEIRLTAEVTPDDYAVDYSAVTWSSSKPAVADVDENGIVSFTGTAGTAKITAAAADGSKKTATVTFTVADLLDGFEISGEKELVGGKSATYKALNEDTGKALKSSQVTWSMDAQYAPYASITAAGKLTTKKVMEAVDVTLTATLVEDPEIVREIVVTIYPAVTGVEIIYDGNPVNSTTIPLDMEAGDTVQLSAAVYPEDAMEGVTWKPSSAKIATVDENGLVTCVKAGTVTITAAAKGDSKKTASVKLKFGTYAAGVEIKDSSLELASGSTLNLSAVVTNSDDTTSSSVTWTLKNASDKSYLTITSAGKVTAKAVNNPTEVTVVATSKDGFASDELTLTVVPKSTTALLIKNGDTYVTKGTVVLNNNKEDGNSVDLDAWNLDGSEQNVTWKSSNEAYAVVDEYGVVTFTAPGTVTVTAADTAAARTATVTVKCANLATGVTVKEKTSGESEDLTLGSGKTMTLAAAVEGVSKASVTWSVEPAALASITAKGKLTAKAGLTREEIITVTATAADGSGESGSVEITLTPLAQGIQLSASNMGEVTNCTVTHDMGGAELQLSAKVYPEEANDSVTWKSSSKYLSIDADGSVTCTKAGTYTITATADDGSGTKAAFKLTMVKKVTDIAMAKTAVVAGGKKLTLTASAAPSDATNKKVTWSISGDTAFAAISAKGVLTTKAVTAPKTVTVTATAADGSDISASCEVTIYPATTSVKILHDSAAVTGTLELKVGDTLELQGSCLPGNAADVYTWKSSAAANAEVDADGTVTAVKAGKTVTITCTAADGSGKSATVKIKIVK